MSYFTPYVARKERDMGGRIVSLDAKTADLFVTTEGLLFVSDWNAGVHVREYEG